MKYALIENNIVKDIFIEPEGFTIDECFHPDIVPLYIPCPEENICEGDLYDPNSKKFTESPNKKYPNYSEWVNCFNNKSEQIKNYSLSLNPIINNFSMNIENLDSYKTKLGFVLTGVDDFVEIDNFKFTGDEFKLMINALKKFEEDKLVTVGNHFKNMSEYNNAADIESYDYSSNWPETTISI